MIKNVFIKIKEEKRMRKRIRNQLLLALNKTPA